MTCNCKAALSANSTAGQTVPASGYVDFTTNTLLVGCSIRHTAGSNSISIPAPGIYQVAVNADLSPAAAGDVTMQLLKNGAAVDGAKATATGAVGDTYTVAFTGIIRVLPSCPAVDNTAVLQVQISAAATLSNANITVVRLG